VLFNLRLAELNGKCKRAGGAGFIDQALLGADF